MSDYTKITDYAAKDALLTGNPAKLVKGTEIGADFDAVAVAVATKANSASPTITTPTLTSPTITGTITAAIANFSGLVTAALGLTVSGGAFNSRGITDNATAKALTLSGSGANSVTIANSATNPSINTSAGQLFLGAVGTDVVAISGGSQLVQLSSNGVGVTTQLAINKTGTTLSGTYPRMLDLNHAAFAGGNAFGIAWRSSSRYDWIGQEVTSGHFSIVLNTSGTPFTAFASDSSSVYLGGASTAPALKVVPGGGNVNWVTITGSATNPTIGTSAGSLATSSVFMPVQATTAGAPAYVKGGMYFDTTLNKLRIGGATAWETVTSV